MLHNHEQMFEMYELKLAMWDKTVQKVEGHADFAKGLLREERQARSKQLFRAQLGMWSAIGLVVVESIVFSIALAKK